MRNKFIQKLEIMAAKDERIALMVGDLGYNVIEGFANRFPNRFFNAGIAEQNMMGLAAGMAAKGFIPFVYSIGNFPTFRCAEQIRNDVDYHNLPVVTVSVGGGVAYGNLGYSHHAVQDYALMRTFPNMLIASPGDPTEVAFCMQHILENPQPTYLRLGKAGEPVIRDDISEKAIPGEPIPITCTNKDSNKAIISTGNTLSLVSNFLKKSKEYGFQQKEWDLFSLPLWSMASKALFAKSVQKYDTIVFVEEHLFDGGFASWGIESLLEHGYSLPRIETVSLSQKVCGMVGSQKELHEKGGLSLKDLAAATN